MTPKMYCERHGITATKFAKRIGLSKQQASRLVAGSHQTTPERAREIERLTDGEITRHDLRPDVFDPPAAADGHNGEVSENATAAQERAAPRAKPKRAA